MNGTRIVSTGEKAIAFRRPELSSSKGWRPWLPEEQTKELRKLLETGECRVETWLSKDWAVWVRIDYSGRPWDGRFIGHSAVRPNHR